VRPLALSSDEYLLLYLFYYLNYLFILLVILENVLKF